MQSNILKIHDEFKEIDTRTIDDRNRLTLGELVECAKRVRIYRNDRGEVLLQPVVEIPASEIWLFQNQKALESVKKGSKMIKDLKKNTMLSRRQFAFFLKTPGIKFLKLMSSPV